MKYLWTVFLICLCFNSISYGQANSDVSSHAAAAAELLEISQTEQTIIDAIDMMLELQIQQNSIMAEFEDVMRAFLDKHMDWQLLKDDYVNIYVDAFTEAELRDLIAFYKTETGQKAVTLMPKLMQQGAALGQRQVMENQHELEALIMARMQQSSASEPEQEAGNEPSEAELNDYHVMKDATVFHPEGHTTSQLAFNTQEDVERFFTQLENNLGAYEQQGNDRIWKQLSQPSWSNQAVRLTITAVETKGQEDIWQSVHISALTFEGEDLLIPATPSYETIKAYLQSMVDATLIDQ